MGNASFMAANDHRRKWFKNRWLTTHTLRRGGAQHRFFFAKAKYRWSLKMIKYWSGWSEKDGNDVIMKYLLDESYNADEDLMADALAPDRLNIMEGCTTQWSTTTHPARTVPVDPEDSFSKTMKKMKEEITSMKEMMIEMINTRSVTMGNNIITGDNAGVISESDNNSESITGITDNTGIADNNPTLANEDIIPFMCVPTSNSWDNCIKYYYFADPSVLLHKAIKDFTLEERSRYIKKETFSKINKLSEAFAMFHKNTEISADGFDVLLHGFKSHLLEKYEDLVPKFTVENVLKACRKYLKDQKSESSNTGITTEVSTGTAHSTGLHPSTTLQPPTSVSSLQPSSNMESLHLSKSNTPPAINTEELDYDWGDGYVRGKEGHARGKKKRKQNSYIHYS